MLQVWKKATSLLRSNRGSGIVTVLVSMLFVSILGTTLLYMSYTGLLIKVTERQGKETFYDAAAAMNEVEAGVQQVVSDSIAEAYRSAMVHYSSYYASGRDMTEQFQEDFRSQVFSWRDGHGDALFSNVGGGNYQYQTAVLEAFVSAPDVTLSAAGTGRASYRSGSIVLEGVQTTYADSRGYESTITSDIAVAMPDFDYLFAEHSISGIPEFAVIAKTMLKQEVGRRDLNITGSAYAGAVQLNNTGSSLTVGGGTLICKTDVTVQDAGPVDSARFFLMDNATLWSERIILSRSGNAVLAGTAYVADDLALEGESTGAAITGSYYGFGSSTTDAAKSSAILVNGTGTTLDLSQAKRLMLAGHSFISETGAYAMMGESLSVKSNQQAYLVPASELVDENGNAVPQNPLVLSQSAIRPDVSFKAGSALQGYGASKPKQLVRILNGAGQQVCYYFMNFSDVEQANAYFRDYFTSNQSQISEYVKLYTDLSAAQGGTQTSGYTLVEDPDGGFSLRSYVSPDSLSTASTQMGAMFAQLCKTLSTSPSHTSTADNPYDYLVNSEKLSSLSDEMTFFNNAAGETAALIYTGSAPLTIDSYTPASIRVILATGDVTVERDFEGLIISGGTITMTQTVTAVSASEDDVVAAFTAVHNGTQFKEYLQLGETTPGHSESGGTTDSWSPDRLVSLRNWSKS